MRPITYPLAAEGILTRVIECGKGPAIVFIHGLGARADRWAGNVASIGAAGYRAIAFDFPGHGLAQKGEGCPTTVPEIAKFVVAVLDRLEIKDAILVGTSLGAHIIGYAATLCPGRFTKLVLVGALGIVPLADEIAEKIRQSVKAAAREQIVAKLNSVIFNPAQVTEELIEEEWRINNSPGALISFTAIGDYLVTGLKHDYVAEKLRTAYTPDKMLLVWGAEDKAVPLSVGHACVEVLGGVELAIIPNAGHAPYYEQQGAFEEKLLSFIK
jgi:pimeloyl-ACP methyl ester carboxylesterase